ncbi:MAG: hypothetical protein JNM36_10030 [Chitinophagales bacterium]|jgi:hypothetical protein|nr:hypothetical protein [Chitinophagales bacterium]HNI44055.1 hypothetical protein [Chitinophagales bacterium]
MKYIYQLIRFAVGAFFIFSGVVKAIDPMGTGFKMEEYFEVFSEAIPFLSGFWEFLAGFALPIAIAMIVFEIFLGVSLLLGTLRNITLWGYVVLIGFFTILTGYSAYTGKVTDCGCFGDFMKLKPIQTFGKDVLLSFLTLFLILFRKYLTPIFNQRLGIGILVAATLWALWFDMRNVWDLPVVDFRAYKAGADMNQGRSTEGLDEGDVRTYYTLNNKSTGESKEIDSKEYMAQKLWEDKNWEIDKDKTKSVTFREPELPKMKDLIINNAQGVEITDSILAMPGYKLWILAYQTTHYEPTAEGFVAINALAKQAREAGWQVMGVSNLSPEQINAKADTLYQFNVLDATPVKTIMRSNPGVVLVKDALILDKWHWNHLPTLEDIKKKHKIK